MCGVCGKSVVPDPVLGPVRTLRQQLIVAHTVNAVCEGISGVPKVAALSDAWQLTGAKGEIDLRHTVGNVWMQIVDRLVGTADLVALRERLIDYAADPHHSGLPGRVARTGSELASEALRQRSR